MMSQNYIRLFYLEIISLAAITVLYAASLQVSPSVPGSICEHTAWTVIPYMYFHFDEVCAHQQTVIAIAVYYVLSVSVAGTFQYFYLKGRKNLTILSGPRFLLGVFIIAFILFAWILGRHSNNDLFNFKLHGPEAWGIYVIPIVLPSFQFILSILMLGERE